MIWAHPERYFWTDIYLLNSRWYGCSTVTGTISTGFNSNNNNDDDDDDDNNNNIIIVIIIIYSNKWIRKFYKVTYYKLYGLIIYTGKIVQQSVAWFFNSGRHVSSTVTSTIVQQSLARLFNSRWHDCSRVTGMIVQQSLARLFNSG